MDFYQPFPSEAGEESCNCFSSHANDFGDLFVSERQPGSELT